MALQTRMALIVFGLLSFSFNSKLLKNSVSVRCKMTLLTMTHLCLKVFLVDLRTQTSSLRFCTPLRFGHHMPGVVSPHRQKKEQMETKIKETPKAFPKPFTTPCQIRFQIRLYYFFFLHYLFGTSELSTFYTIYPYFLLQCPLALNFNPTLLVL